MPTSQAKSPQTLIAVVAETLAQTPQAIDLARRYELPLLELNQCEELGFALTLWVSEDGIGLKQVGTKDKPVYVDFVSGAAGYRGAHAKVDNELIARAIGLKRYKNPKVLDLTAGLGRDAFILAALGCAVSMIERNPLVALLLDDGIERGKKDAEVGQVLTRIQLIRDDALNYLGRLAAGDMRPDADILYLDPMFPSRRKAASVKKELRALQLLVASDDDSRALFQLALKSARKRVVVKRPKQAGPIDERAPDFSVKGNSGRFDVYLLAQHA